MHALPSAVDCLIAGAGPAGATLAGILSRHGLRVLLCDDGRPTAASPVETLLPSSLAAMDRCGLGEFVRANAQADRRRHGARWDTDELVFRDEPRPGLCLLRPAFDRALQQWAASGGALLATDARVVGPSVTARDCDHESSRRRQWDVRLRGEMRAVDARALVLATGRNARLDAFAVTECDRGPETAALAFALPPGSHAHDRATVVATRDGWCWSIGDGEGRATAVACFAAKDSDASSRVLAHRVLVEAGACARDDSLPLTGAVRATVRRREAPLGVFLLGDAAASLDPLASQGTEKALVGAEHLATLIRCALGENDDVLLPAASAAHAQWEHDLFTAHVRATAGFYSRVQHFVDAPFWRERSRTPVVAPALPLRLVCASGLAEHRVLVRNGRDAEVAIGFGVDLRQARARVGRAVLEPLLRAFATPTGIDRGIADAGQDARLFPLGTAVVRAAVAEAVRLGFLVAS